MKPLLFCGRHMATALTAQALESGPCGHTAVSSQAGHPTPTTPMSFSIKCEQWRCIFHGWLQTLNEIIHREAPEQSLWAEHTLHQHWALFPSWVVCVCVCVTGGAGGLKGVMFNESCWLQGPDSYFNSETVAPGFHSQILWNTGSLYRIWENNFDS